MGEINFKLLEVDLTTGKKEVKDVTGDVKKYLGGRGLGAKLLWDNVPPGADPLGPENILYLGIGPLTGLLGGVVSSSFRAPLTNLTGRSCMNGHFGSELAAAGYRSGLLIKGKASKPVYLFIKNDDVEIRDASRYWGKMNSEVQYHLKDDLKKDLDDQNFRIASIGPAGEAMVRNADIAHDIYHHAARLGGGAVMGSKNLKAIAVRGTKTPEYADHKKVFDIITTFFHEARQQKARFRRWGLSSSTIQRYYQGTEGVKNKQLGWDESCDLANPLLLEQRFKVWGDGCNMCPLSCKVPFMRRDGPLGPTVGEFRHDSAGGWSANVLLKGGFDTQTYLSPLVDNLGMDNEDVSGVVAWMMECYDRGLVTKEELDGIDLTWGNIEAICQLLERIAKREGIGNTLAEGLKFAPPKIGKGTEKYAMHSKGVAITSYELRGRLSDAVSMVVNACGGLHADRGGPLRMIADCLTICNFHRGPLTDVFGSFPDWGVNMLNAACGWNITKQDWEDFISRTNFLERCYAMRDGYLPSRDDTIPDRFFDETIHHKYGQAMKLDRKEFLEQRKILYEAYGLNQDGIPPQASLKRLGLDFVIPTLEKVMGHWT